MAQVALSVNVDDVYLYRLQIDKVTVKACRKILRGLQVSRNVVIKPKSADSSTRPNVRAETCFFGVVNLSRAALPVMRRQRSGHIIQISSVGGRIAVAGNAAYHASIWAVGGFTEALALEVAPFGVKVTALEPGGMRTNWGARAFGDRPTVLPDYDASVGAIMRMFEAY